MPASHECPVHGCIQKVSAAKLMCHTHWYMVPASIRITVYAEWANGFGAGSGRHRAACLRAIEAVNHKLGAAR